MMTDYKRTYSQRGDDYLLEAQRVCRKGNAPRCPYCGTPMVGEEKIEGTCWYECYKCGATAPTEETVQAAYEAAMQRWREPNRVLTLEEVRERYEEGTSDSPLWIDFKQLPVLSRWYALQVSDVFFATDTVGYYLTGQAEKYNFDWRCWLRKPTQEEMATTLWREK